MLLFYTDIDMKINYTDQVMLINNLEIILKTLFHVRILFVLFFIQKFRIFRNAITGNIISVNVVAPTTLYMCSNICLAHVILHTYTTILIFYNSYILST